MLKKWTGIGALGMGVVIALSTPISAQADTSILLSEKNIKNEAGEVLLSLQEGDHVETSIQADGSLLIHDNYSTYEIDKEEVLTVMKTTEKKWKAKEGAMLYASPDLFSTPLREVSEGTELLAQDSSAGWLQVEESGWVHVSQAVEEITEEAVKKKAFIANTQESEGTPLFKGDEVALTSYADGLYTVSYNGANYKVSKADVTDVKPANTDRTFQELFEFAKKQLGKPYVWGGNGSPGYDCSGFTTHVFAQVGISLPRTAATQSIVGKRVSLTELKPGDMLFFETYKPGPSHVAIYIGGGEMIHAAGKQVHIAKINAPYWSDRYLHTMRVLD